MKKIWLTLFGCWMLMACQQTPTPMPTRPMPTLTPSVTPPIGVAFATIAPPTVAVLQTTPTPLPTPTNTPTATPVIYNIEAGDTIWTIAAKSGREVQVILAMNPDLRPELLSIGQAVLLPPAPTPIFQGGRSTPIPLQVSVVGVVNYGTVGGGMWLLGVVVNEGDMPAQNIQVAIDLLDSTGTATDVAMAWVVPAIIMPAQSAPFGVLLRQPPPDFVQPRVSVAGGETMLQLGSRYLDLAVRESAVNIDGNRVSVSGQVVNIGVENAGNLTLVATFFDGQDQISGFAQLHFDQSLSPDEALPFNFDIAPPGGQTVRVEMVVQGEK